MNHIRLASIFETSMVLRYLTAGAIAAVVQIVALFLLVQSIRAPETVLSCAAFVVAVVVNYLLQRTFTFGSDAPHSIVFPRFATVAFFGFFLNAIIFYAFSHAMNYLLAQFFTILIVLIFNFVMNKKFVFSYKQ
jgi:putative flippase GtrA